MSTSSSVNFEAVVYMKIGIKESSAYTQTVCDHPGLVPEVDAFPSPVGEVRVHQQCESDQADRRTQRHGPGVAAGQEATRTPHQHRNHQEP